MEKVFDVAGQIVCTSCYTSEVKAAQAEEESANTRYAPSEEKQTGDAPTSQSIATKGCPFCGEQIKAKAIKCRFCGEMLDTPTGDETGGYAPTTVGRPNGRQRRNDTGQIPQCVLRRESQRCLSVFCIFMMNLVFGLFYAVTLGDHHPSKSLSIWDGVIMGMGVLVIVSGVYSMVWLPSHWRVIMRLPLHRRLLGLIGGFGLILVVVVGILFLPFGQWGLILVGLAFVVRWLLRVSREVH